MAVQITRAGVGLTIGIIILGLMVLGGLYLAKERGEQARRDAAIQIASQNLEDQSNQTKTLTPEDEGGSSGIKSAEVTGGAAGGATDGVQGKEDSGGTGSGAVTTLPQTGPEGSTVNLLAIGLLVLGVGYYYGSRRALKASMVANGLF